MQTFRKYEFTPTQWATAKKKIEKTGTDPEGETYTYWDTELVAVVVELGKLCTEWGTDTSGNIPTGMAQLIVNDYLSAGYNSANAYSQALLFKTRLSNEQLQTLTSL
jgi:hypothetical protein